MPELRGNDDDCAFQDLVNEGYLKAMITNNMSSRRIFQCSVIGQNSVAYLGWLRQCIVYSVETL
jgi:hypothetical protein